MEAAGSLHVFGLSGNLLATAPDKILQAISADFAAGLKTHLQLKTGIPSVRQRLFWGEAEVCLPTCPWDDSALPVNLQMVIMPLRQDKIGELHAAVALGKLENVQQLLSEGQDPNLPGKEGVTPLLIAADRRRLQIAAALTEASANPNIPGEAEGGGATPLIAAAAHGDTRMVQHLLHARASPDLSGSDGKSPLLTATLHGHLAVVECLVGALCDIDRPVVGQACTNPLFSAAESNHSRIVAALLRARADIDWQNMEGKTPLWCAVANGSLQSARCLIRAGASTNCPDQHGDAPLWVAAACGQSEAVDCLIAARADVNQAAGNGQSPLCMAALRCDLPVLRSLMRAGADQRPDRQGRTPAEVTLSPEVKKELHGQRHRCRQTFRQ
ncbi:secG, partial [Symbiodinium natans]